MSCVSSNNADKAFTTSAGRAWKNWRPFLKKERLKWWNARNAVRGWPPQDATPVMPIEPYGKSFFVYSARKHVQAWGDPRAPCKEDTAQPQWVKDDWIKEMGLFKKNLPDKMKGWEAEWNPKNLPLAPMLCITDYRKRVLGYFSKAEWEDFMKAIPKIKLAMMRFKNDIPPPSEDIDAIELDKRHFMPDKNRFLKIASAGSADNTSHGGITNGNPRNGEFQRKFRKKKARDVLQKELAPILRQY